MKKPTMREIGKAVGVSAVTVSKALAGKEGMTEAVRQKIIRAAEDMGYRNPRAEKEPEKRTLNIGVLMAERYFSPESFYAILYKKLAAELTERGHFGTLELLGEEAEGNRELPGMLRSGQVDGMILLGETDKEYYRMLARRETPVVFLDFYDGQGTADAVVGDNTYGCYRLTSHLIKNGHRDIGFVGTRLATGSIMDRFLGYYRAMLIHGLPVREEWILSDRSEQGERIPLALPEKLPTAFVCNCDLIAGDLIDCLADRGIRVPEDVSVTGFDDFLIGPGPEMGISTFRTDTDSMIRLAIDAMLERCAGGQRPFGRTVVSGQPVYRGSERALQPDISEQ